MYSDQKSCMHHDRGTLIILHACITIVVHACALITARARIIVVASHFDSRDQTSKEHEPNFDFATATLRGGSEFEFAPAELGFYEASLAFSDGQLSIE